MRRDVDQPQESSKTGLSAPQANSATQRSVLDALAERVGLSSTPVDAASLASDRSDSFSFSFPKGHLAGDEASFHRPSSIQQPCLARWNSRPWRTRAQAPRTGVTSPVCNPISGGGSGPCPELRCRLSLLCQASDLLTRRR